MIHVNSWFEIKHSPSESVQTLYEPLHTKNERLQPASETEHSPTEGLHTRNEAVQTKSKRLHPWFERVHSLSENIQTRQDHLYLCYQISGKAVFTGVSRYRGKLTTNARHHPPRRAAELRQVSRMRATLFAVGCMPLLDFAAGNIHNLDFYVRTFGNT